MTTVYLHIGTMKTGTSALQKFLDVNRNYLEKQGYAFPEMKVGMSPRYNFRNAHFLVYPTDADQPVPVDELKKNAYAHLAEVAKQYDKIILTDEVIWHRSTKEKDFWPNLVADFKKINCEVKIILYLRRQDLFAESLYNQVVKSNMMVSKQFLDYIHGNVVKSFVLHYYEHVKEIEQYIGKENITLRVYEKGQFEGNEKTIFSDFLKTVGLSYDENYRMEEAAINLGLQGNYIELKRIINGLPEYKEMGDFMSRPLRAASAAKTEKKLHGKETFFTDEAQADFMAQFAEGNRKLAQEYLGREDGTFFMESLGNLMTWKLDQESIYQDIMMAMAETFCAQEKRIDELSGKVRELEIKVNKIDWVHRLGRKIKRIFQGN